MVQRVVPLFGGYGRAVYDDDALMPVGERAVPREIFVEVRGGTNEADIAMKIEVRQGIPVYTELVLRARPDSPKIRGKDLESLYLSDWLEEIVAGGSWTLPTESGRMLTFVKEADLQEALTNVRRVRSKRKRSRVSQERLQKVAEVYREHINERPTEAVSRVFGVSHRTAARYVQQARESGHLPDTTLVDRLAGEAVGFRTLTDKEMFKILDHDCLDRHLWALALYGLRRGEISGLRWANVNLTDNTVSEGGDELPPKSHRIVENRVAIGREIAVGTPKSKASNRTLPMPDEVVELLKPARKRQREERLAFDGGTGRMSMWRATRQGSATTRICSYSGGAEC